MKAIGGGGREGMGERSGAARAGRRKDRMELDSSNLRAER